MERKVIFTVLLFSGLYYMFYLAGSDTKADDKDNSSIYEKIAAGKDYQYLVVGDSIGRGAGAENQELTWFSQLEELIRNEFGGKGTRHAVVQSGATAFEGIFKLQNTRMPDRIDAAFIVFGENDRKYMDAGTFSAHYEKIVRHLIMHYPSAQIFTITENSLDQEEFAGEISKITEYYGAVNIDMRVPFRDSGLTVQQLTTDLVHPNGKGYRLYAEQLFKVMSSVQQKTGQQAELIKPLNPLPDIQLTEQSNYKEKKGFTFYNGLHVSTKQGDFIEYEFTGPELGVTVLRSEFGGLMDVYIDDAYHGSISTWWPIDKQRNLYIASGLGDRSHTVKFVVKDERSESNITNRADIAISSIIIAEKQ
ncbi:SGNH/GDSL hydrolase family protein [Bacillus canaveralius]|uniref:SGNH/GDSL hydrolase family protein n=1 Tax=Bacillus canaveralius TaxID=1403243 RepID=A0A2N5GJ13_9BACI|nr:SGNH/GDSL hydrolase family protein [Bacillus canaveralius]PLR81044.1 SGNH/GDSL hydrolase family protein [Bacillus canaveralius]PLR98982.1 SGNH/GDSL hydrolase family protein [Bacillus canaveralius]